MEGQKVMVKEKRTVEGNLNEYMIGQVVKHNKDKKGLKRRR